MQNPSPKLHKPDPVDWKKALKKFADALGKDMCCFPNCPAMDICQADSNSDDHRCRRVILKWARGKF